LSFHIPHFNQKYLRSWLPLVLIGVAAFVIRAIYLFELRDTPLFAVLIGDGKQYDSWARQIAAGQWLGTEVFYQTPLYPYFLAVIFKLAGHSLLTVRLVQALLGAASCVLLGLAARRWFDQKTALVAAAMLAIYPPAIFFDGLVQKSSLDLFLICALLAAIAEFIQRRNWMWLALAGFALGAFTLNRENARVLYPVIVIFVLVYFRDLTLTKRLAWSAMFTVAVALMLLPVGYRNYHVAGEFLISTSQLGPNLYIGNHPGASGSYEPLVPGHGNAAYEREDATRLAETAMHRQLSPSEVSNYWVRRSLEYIRSHPNAWVKLMIRKIGLTFAAKETVDTESIEAYSDYSLTLRLLFWFTFGVVLPLAVLGAWLTRKDWRKLALLYAMVFGMAIAVALFYVVARYRYPLAPILIMFAAAALVNLPRLRTEKLKAWLPGALLAVAVALPSNLLFRMANDDTLLNVGEELVRAGRPSEAISVLRKAAQASPDYAPTYFNLGIALNESGRKEEALDAFDAAIKTDPNYFEARAAMGLTLLETGRPTGAVTQFREAARLRPDAANVHRDLGNALAQAGQRSEAIKEYQEALRLNANDAPSHNSLAVTLQQEGRVDDAIRHYQDALLLQPDNAGTRSNLALAFEAKGDHDAAIKQFQQALQLQPANATIHMNFGDMLARFNQFEEAIGEYEQAVKSNDSVELRFQLAQYYEHVHRIDEAIANLERASALATTGGRYDEARQINSMIDAWRARRTSSTSTPKVTR
jgi:tetratricopeptide (TPR) repeat protein